MSSRFSYRTFYKRRARPTYTSGVRKRYTAKYRAGRHAVGRVSKSGAVYGSKPLAMGLETKDVTINLSAPVATIGCNSATVYNQNLSTGFLICNLVQQGNTNQNRDGNIVSGVHLGLRFQLQPGANTELSDAVVRYMVILDRSPNSNIAVAMQDILTDISETGATSTTYNSGINPRHRNRFMIMRQGTTELSKISGPQALINVSMSCPLYGLQTGYTGSANPMTAAYIYANALYFLIFSRMTGAGTLPVVNEFVCRYTFKEK